MNDLSISEYPVHFKKIIKQERLFSSFWSPPVPPGITEGFVFPVEIAPPLFPAYPVPPPAYGTTLCPLFMITAVNLQARCPLFFHGADSFPAAAHRIDRMGDYRNSPGIRNQLLRFFKRRIGHRQISRFSLGAIIPEKFT